MSDTEISGTAAAVDKGKEKEALVEEEVETSDDEDVEEEAGPGVFPHVEELEDDLDVLDTGNILGRRTRGKQIDYEKADRDLPKEPADADDSDDDDDYVAQEEATNDDMDIDG